MRIMKSARTFGIGQAVAVGLMVGFALSSASSCGTRPPMTTKCTSATCPDGCCDDQGMCQQQSPSTCGISGQTCVSCSLGQSCVAGSCRIGGTGGGGNDGGTGGGTGGGSGGGATGGGGGGGSGCSASTCASGCCNNGQCVPFAQQNFTRCGTSGAQCAGCPTGQACSMGRCAAPQCNNCLDTAGNCRGGPSDNAYCGANGSVCARCDTTNGQMCVNGRCSGGTTSCDSTNCAGGCCSGNTCVMPTSDAQCGLNGSLCQTCSGSSHCDTASGMCQGGGLLDGGFDFDGGFFPACDPSTCPNGCCHFFLGCMNDGDPFPPDDAGTAFAQVCGTGGNICQTCIGTCQLGMTLGLCF
jgi:hypothetical protein